MEWTPEAETAIKKVPFFVRKRVRARVEKEAAAGNRPRVSLADVKAVHGYVALRGIIKPRQQIHESALARTAGTDQSDALSKLDA